ncbi:MAG: beta-ketoacyl synthase N-terminal-like domain-containing protein [Nannocystaceae bacterium]
MSNDLSTNNSHDIAIIGMAAHLPGAPRVSDYWRNLCEGVESVQNYTDDELIAAGVTAEALRNRHYIKRGAPIPHMEDFDAEFFGFSPKEAAIMDPQHRHFLECAWEALEDAGYPPERCDGPVGVFAGCGAATYLMFNLLSNPDLVDDVGFFLLRHTGNDKDFLATRVSYIFDLKGPSINVQTACSTSLVAVHVACQQLLSGECDLALVGGSTIEQPHRRGYLYKKGEILSPDGHCHAFDHRAAGTVFGSGAGAVVLRRLSDAQEAGDRIYAVIRGSAVNNDGSNKVSYLAPGVEGQADAISEAIDMAGITADTIGYVETHGTGTVMGDPIEISAMTQAFRETTDQTGYCAVASGKTNIGHLDTAAGVASLIKAALCLHHRKLPPSLNYEAPNPMVAFDGSPFFVNTELREWNAPGGHPRRAGVNALGVGGTNVHVVLEEAPRPAASGPSSCAYQLLTLSARNRSALDDACTRLADHLVGEPGLSLADVAHTLIVGRRAFDQRRVLACRDRDEAIALLRSRDSRRVFTHTTTADTSSVVFMLPGGGVQSVGMGRGLLDSEPVFREHVVRGIDAFAARANDYDLRNVWFGDPGDASLVEEFQRPAIQLPAIFILEYALAQLWMSWGLKPKAFIGHSLGENTAACLAGTMSFDDCLGLVTLRGQLFERVPPGGMLSVSLPHEQLVPLLDDTLDLAAINSPGLCAVSGPAASIDAMAQRLKARDVDCQRIPINIAAHSRMLEPILADFHAYLASIELKAPRIPFVSNRSGDFITAQQATDPTYWVEHLRNTVRFSDGVKRLLADPNRVFIEVGPGRVLGSLVRQQPDLKPVQSTLSSLRHPEENVPDIAFFVTALGRAWASGAEVDLGALQRGERRRHVSLPSYAFQRKRFFYEPGKTKIGESDGSSQIDKLENVEDWYYVPAWKRRGARGNIDGGEPLNWLVFTDEGGVGDELCERLRRRGHNVVSVAVGDTFYKESDQAYLLAPEQGREGYEDLMRALVASGRCPTRIVHLWMLTEDDSFRAGSTRFHRNQEYGFYSLLSLAQVAGVEELSSLHITVVSNGMQRVEDEGLPYPEKATVLGPVRVIPREYPGTTASSIDVELPASNPRRPAARKEAAREFGALADRLMADMLAEPARAIVAYRGNRRFEQGYEQTELDVPLGTDGTSAPPFKPGGVYLITGGLGGIGGVVAEYVAASAAVKLVLIGRTGLPERSGWESWLTRHGPHDPISMRINQVARLEDLGAEVMTVAASVTDIDQLRRAVEDAEKRFGAVNGVLHAAGVLSDDLIQGKSSVEVEEVFAPKVHGTRVIEAVFSRKTLDFLVLFSSTSSVIAPAGQVDYVAANAFLNAYAQSKSQVERRTVAINWGVWNEVGMAADAASKMGAAPAVREKVAAKHPLFIDRAIDRIGGAVLTAAYSPSSHWLFDEHRTGAGHAVMPGTGYLELARAALREHGDVRPFEIRDFLFLRPLYVADGSEQKVRVRLRHDAGAYTFDVQSERVVDDGRAGWETHATAELRPLSGSRPEPLPLGAIDARCDGERTPDTPEGIRADQEAYLRFGPRWRVLRQVFYGDGEALARLELPAAYAADLDDYLLHPALLDFAVGYAMRLIDGYPQRNNSLWVPLSYRTVRVYAPLPRRVLSWARNRGDNRVEADFASFDVTIVDEAGHVVLEVEDFTIKRLSASVDFAVIPTPLAHELEFDAERTGDRQLSPAEAAFHHNLERGILPAEGMAALDRLLRCDAVPPMVVVSSLDLHALERQASVSAAAVPEEGSKFARPELDSEYVEPRDDVEKALVAIWREILGIEAVGVEDSFFDLGGHSLIAVRLFARVKKLFDVEYPISVLFEAPTIARCAALIREATGITGEEASAESGPAKGGGSPSKAEGAKFRYLVPMHEGRRDQEAPFFMVAGMFGNVLNLRHLANHVGVDRPFYGIQARGLHGEEAPHEDFPAMARDYIDEMRRVQPHGPYYLGGFSGGGMAVYEMAHQLIAADEQIGVLVLLDTPLHHEASLTVGDKYKIHSQELRRQGLGYLSTKIRSRYERRLSQWQGGEEESVENLPPAAFRSETIRAAFDRACHAYDVPDYPGVVTLFRPRLDERYDLGDGRKLNHDREYVYSDNGWGRHVQRVDVCEVPGDHDGMVLEPNVRVIASELRGRIQAFLDGGIAR